MKKAKNKYPYGVYLNKKGKLLDLREGDETIYVLLNGNKSTNKMVNFVFKCHGKRVPYMEWLFDEGYFADKFLKDARYLGEL